MVNVKSPILYLTIKIVKRSLIVWTSLHAKKEPNAWQIGSGFFNDMTRDRRKFINLKKWNGGSVKFGAEEVA